MILDLSIQDALASLSGSLIALYYLYVHGYPIVAPAIEPVRRLSPVIQLCYALICYTVVAYCAANWIFGASDVRQFFLASLSTSLIICGRTALVLRVAGAHKGSSFVMRIATG